MSEIGGGNDDSGMETGGGGIGESGGISESGGTGESGGEMNAAADSAPVFEGNSLTTGEFTSANAEGVVSVAPTTEIAIDSAQTSH
jgi:hypothetical protein